MKTPVRLSLVALAIAVTATVVGGSLVSTDEAAAATQQTLRIPAAAFEPINQGVAYWNSGLNIRYTGSGTSIFVAPVTLQGNLATVHSVRLHYYDNGPDEICAFVFRPNLKAGGEKKMSSMCTKNAVDDRRTKIDTTIKYQTVGSDNAAYVWLTLPAGSLYGVGGVTIVYTPDVAPG